MLRLTALAKSLRYVPGQKQVILFSTGIANSLIYGSLAEPPASTPRGPSDEPRPAAQSFEVGDRS